MELMNKENAADELMKEEIAAEKLISEKIGDDDPADEFGSKCGK